MIVTVMVRTGFTVVAYALEVVSKMNCGEVTAEIGDQQFAFQQKCGLPNTTAENGQFWKYDLRPDDVVYYVAFTTEQVGRIQVGGND